MARAVDGVRFRLFPDWAENPAGTETIWLNLPPGMVGPGPSDPWMYVVDAIGKPPYSPPGFGPPYRGASRPPAMPDGDGHFDHIGLDDPAFGAAHLYGSVRFSLDVWEKYFGRELAWHAQTRHPRLELIPHVDWDNAQSGPGFLETGARQNSEGERQPYSLIFDVVAHEVGHTVLFSVVGLPSPQGLTSEFLAFHESMSDIAALVAMMHFKTVLGNVLGKTHGNLYVLNMLNRFGILSGNEQLRICDNTAKMEDVAGLRLGPAGAWIDPTGRRRNAHDLAAPLTGGLFDLLVELFQDGLVARGVLDESLDYRQWSRAAEEQDFLRLADRFRDSFAAVEPLFHEALKEARDTLGFVLASAFDRLDPSSLTYARFAGLLLECLGDELPEADVEALADNFVWRGILPEAQAATDARRGLRPASATFGARASALRRRDVGAVDANDVHRLINHDHRSS